MAGTFSTIEIERQERVMTIRLNRPSALNAFNREMGVELAAALRTAQRDDNTRCVVLTGAGRGFCAGQDVREFPTPVGGDAGEAAAYDLGAYLREYVNPLATRIRSLEKPVIAAVNGVAAGAGVSFALACDLRICARNALFKLAFLQVGLVPDAGCTLTLMQHVGYGRAAELCLLGDEVWAEQALRIGLVNRVVDDQELPDATQQLARRLTELPVKAVALTKRALNHAWSAELDEQLRYEAYMQATAGRTADHREGVRAMLEKRSPQFGVTDE